MRKVAQRSCDGRSPYNGQSITYDAIGNPTSYRGATISWNGRKLMSYTKGDDVITYKYDGNGLRTLKVIDGVKHSYYYEDGQLLYEIKQGVYELYYKYDADGNLFSITRYRYSDGEKDVIYAVTNTRGDVIELRAASGAIYATYTYDSWGKCIAVTNSSGAACSVNTVAVQNSIRYRGYVYDYETGLYYLQSRYYDPEVGRFLNADDVEFIGYSGDNLSYNAFAYCENNTINSFDNLGYAKNSEVVISGKKYSCKYAASYRPLWSSYRLNCSIGGVSVYVDYRNGVIEVWNAQSNIKKIFENGKTKTFSYVIKELAKKINKKSLKGRTVEGIAYELICHYIWYKKKILKSNTEVSHCGATSGKVGFDENACIFEKDKSKLNTVESRLKKGKMGSALIEISSTLAKLGWEKIR